MATPKATAQQIATMALRKLGVVNRRSPVQPTDMQDALEALWMLLESFNVNNALIPFYRTISLPLTSTKRVYTIGPGGDFDFDPPMEILDARVYLGGVNYPVDIVNGINPFNNMTSNGDSISARPRQLIWNPSVPCHQITLDVMPSEGTLTLYVLMPWSVNAGASDAPPAGQYVNPADFLVAIDPDAEPYCNDECQLDVTGQMNAWLGEQVDYELDAYSHTFNYLGLQVGATATKTARTEPRATSIGVPAEMEFPMGYSPMIMWCLAEAMLSEYPQANPVVVQSIVTQAKIMRSRLMQKNNKPAQFQVDPSLMALHSRPYTQFYRG